MKDRRASSWPLTTSGSMPSRRLTPATKSSRLRASRVAEVATKRRTSPPGATPSSVQSAA